MSIPLLNWPTWCCCRLFVASNRKCLSILGAATFILFPFGYIVYRMLRSQPGPEEEDQQGEEQKSNDDNDRMKTLVSSFPVIYNLDNSINVITIKKLCFLTVLFSQEELGSIRAKILLLRRKFFGDLEKYIELTLFLYNEYHRILENSLRKVLACRQIERKSFENSLIINERNNLLKKGFLRDAAWSLLSENLGSASKLNRQKMKEYIKTQIQDLKTERKVCRAHLLGKEKSVRQIILSSRVDDLAFAKMNVEDVDYVRCLKYYVNDDEIKRLIEQRNCLLED